MMVLFILMVMVYLVKNAILKIMKHRYWKQYFIKIGEEAANV